MKIFLLFIALTVTSFLYPCNWMLDLVDKKQIESQKILLQFDDYDYSKTEDELTEYEAYWYTVGRAEALSEIQEDINKKN